MPDPLVPLDRLPEDLVRVYADAARHVDALVRLALARGALGTAAYRERQLNVIRAVLAQLRAETPPRVLTSVQAAYGVGALAVDAGVPGARLAGLFTGVHERAVRAIAANMDHSLQAAVTGLGDSVAHVFEIADRIDGALPGARSELGAFLGRRVDDDARRAALQTVAEAIASGSTRRDASSALKARIEHLARRQASEALQLVQDELTGEAKAAFIDRAGRRWDLDVYTRMVARTTTREAATRGTVDRMFEAGEDLITISDHGTTTVLCEHYEGRTFSLTGNTPGYPRIDRLTPFHPNCRHFMRPAGDRFAGFERALGLAA